MNVLALVLILSISLFIIFTSLLFVLAFRSKKDDTDKSDSSQSSSTSEGSDGSESPEGSDGSEGSEGSGNPDDPIDPQPSGSKVLIGGEFTQVNGINHPYLYMLNNPNFISGFPTDAPLAITIRRIKATRDGGFIVVGTFFHMHHMQ